MTTEQIKEARDWLDTFTGYTPGPWRVSYERGTTQIRSADNDSLMCDETYYPWVPDNQNDWTIIAAAPDLRDRYAAALGEIERLRAALGNASDSLDEAFRALGNAGEALGDEGPSREEARAFLAAETARAALKGEGQ